VIINREVHFNMSLKESKQFSAILYDVIMMCFLLFLFSFNSLAQESGYIKMYKPLAKSLEKEFEIPYEVILGVAIIESGAGKTKVSRLHNNHFGIVGKNKTKYKTRYRHFNSAHASFRSFCLLVKRRKFYDSLKGNKDYKVWVVALSKTGYSSQPVVWQNKIDKVIQEKLLNTQPKNKKAD